MGERSDLPNNREYTSCLRQLHRLLRAGEGESEQADVIRDRMDDLWARLTAEQIPAVRQLSARLREERTPVSKPDAAPETGPDNPNC